ncbi:hypothetical protein CVT24_001241 [Panaeolus cyanescens]|uniref:Uncharacterized protein n=1 Tax=Panaeolus cyanescens TaxID=181874 RepID=A0A409YYX1_9AGAR|nr:hypothetical protein CVT24_001241 [Panaeolus cyanescens]
MAQINPERTTAAANMEANSFFPTPTLPANSHNIDNIIGLSYPAVPSTIHHKNLSLKCFRTDDFSATTPPPPLFIPSSTTTTAHDQDLSTEFPDAELITGTDILQTIVSTGFTTESSTINHALEPTTPSDAHGDGRPSIAVRVIGITLSITLFILLLWGLWALFKCHLKGTMEEQSQTVGIIRPFDHLPRRSHAGLESHFPYNSRFDPIERPRAQLNIPAHEIRAALRRYSTSSTDSSRTLVGSL